MWGGPNGRVYHGAVISDQSVDQVPSTYEEDTTGVIITVQLSHQPIMTTAYMLAIYEHTPNDGVASVTKVTCYNTETHPVFKKTAVIRSQTEWVQRSMKVR